MRATAGWLSVLAGVILGANAVAYFVWGASPALWPSSLFAVLSVHSFATAAVVHPASRRRLAERDSVLANGRKRTVVEESVGPEPAESAACVVCGSDVRNGRRRDSQIEYVLAGITVTSRTTTRNWYCEECFRAETAPSPSQTEESRPAEADLETIRE